MKIFERGKKKGQALATLQALVVGLAVLAMVAAVVFVMLSKIVANSQVAADGNATAAVKTVQAAAADIPGWIPLVVIAIIGIAVLGIMALYQRR